MTLDPAAEAADAALAVPVWDLPIRLFHWGLVALIGFSWWSAEYEQFKWHRWSGFAILFGLSFRILWGFLGSSTARFTSFVRGPRAVLRYLGRTGEPTAIGHTPLGALSVVALLSLVAAQVTFGLLLINEDGDWSGPLNQFVGFETGEIARELHGILFWVLLGFIVLHIAAILFYRLVLREGLVRAMVDGRAIRPSGTAPMVAAGPGRLAICLVIAGALTAWIALGAPPFGQPG